MNEMDKKILDRQVELLKGMDENEKALYLAFCEGMLAGKQQGCACKD